MSKWVSQGKWLWEGEWVQAYGIGNIFRKVGYDIWKSVPVNCVGVTDEVAV